jgi:hypothetical protein
MWDCWLSYREYVKRAPNVEFVVTDISYLYVIQRVRMEWFEHGHE